MDPPRLKGFFSRNWRASTSEKKERPEKKSTQGAHELFLEYEGFLAPARPPRPSTSVSRAATSHSWRPLHRTSVKQSEEPLRSSAGRINPHKSISSISNTVVEFCSQRVDLSRKQGSFALPRSDHEQLQGRPYDKPEWPLKNDPEPEITARSTTSSWLRRRMSTASRQTKLSTSPSFTSGSYPPAYTEQPHYRYSIYDDDNITALPAFPSYEKEPKEPPQVTEDRISKGAAARAAAAAQNEVYESIRNFRLEEPKVTRDSESGVGIEVRDRGEVMSDYEMPVVRKGETSSLDGGEKLLTCVFRPSLCSTRRTYGTHTIVFRP